MKTEHTHQFTRSKPSSTVEICSCGKFRFTKNAGPPIVEVSAASVESPRASHSEQTGARSEIEKHIRKIATLSKQQIDTLSEFWGGSQGMLKRIAELETYCQDLEQRLAVQTSHDSTTQILTEENNKLNNNK